MSVVKAVNFVVSDLMKMTKFFEELLEFTLVDIREEKSDLFPGLQMKRARLKLGSHEIYLTQFINQQTKPLPKESISSDLSFQHIAIVVSDMEKAYEKLIKHKIVPISSSPQIIPDWNKAAAGIKAFYFRSPDLHPLELIFYPSGKGRSEWQQKNRLFLGIDHTAITVSDTEKSLKFYRDTVGLRVMGESLNYGETQENLSGVPGAKVKITGLANPEGRGMGLEFLHYLEGTKGKASTYAPHDLAATKTVIEVHDLDKLLQKLDNKSVIKKTQEKEKTRAALVVDPDGHHVIFV
ncbi:MAG: VOC family protein [Chlamydiales bacterium]